MLDAHDIDEGQASFKLGVDVMNKVICWGWLDVRPKPDGFDFKYNDESMLDWLTDESYSALCDKVWDLSGFTVGEAENSESPAPSSAHGQAEPSSAVGGSRA